METVFDYNITDKERENIGISDKERYLAIVGEDTANLDLANNQRKISYRFIWYVKH